jgi:hypothetical protein
MKKSSWLFCFIAILISPSVILLADNQILAVNFIPQCPPGIWSKTMNCGPACLVMSACFQKNQQPNSQMILEIDKILSLNENGGSGTNCNQLIMAGKNKFGLDLIEQHWNINQIKEELKNGGPVITAVKAGCLSNRGYKYSGDHFLVAIGYDSSNIVCNDPGTSKGSSKLYKISEFSEAIQSQGNAVIIGFRKQKSVQEPPEVLINPNQVDNFCPIISSDHNKIAFVSENNFQQSIWLMNSDGTSLENLWTLPNQSKFKQMAFTQSNQLLICVKNIKCELYVMNITDKKSEKLYENDKDFTFNYRNDKNYLILNIGGEIWAFDPNNRKIMSVKDAMGQNPFMFFAPDIWRLLYFNNSGNSSQIIAQFLALNNNDNQIMENKYVLANFNCIISGFEYLPPEKTTIQKGEGGIIVYSSNQNGNYDIFSAHLSVIDNKDWYEIYKLTEVKLIVCSKADEVFSDAFTDANGNIRLLISINKGAGKDIYICNSDGSGITQLTFGANRKKVDNDKSKQENIKKGIGILSTLYNWLKKK